MTPAEEAAMQRLLDFLSGSPARRSFCATNERGAVAVSAIDGVALHGHAAVGEDLAACLVEAFGSPPMPLDEMAELLSRKIEAKLAELDAK